MVLNTFFCLFHYRIGTDTVIILYMFISVDSVVVFLLGLGMKDHDPSKLELPSSPSRAELYQQQVLSERARVQGRRSSLFLSVEGAGSENQAPPLLTQSHSMDDLGELPPPAPVLSPSPTPHTFLHPLTGKPLGKSGICLSLFWSRCMLCVKMEGFLPLPIQVSR